MNMRTSSLRLQTIIRTSASFSQSLVVGLVPIFQMLLLPLFVLRIMSAIVHAWEP
jgi:hypothetical protein